MNETELLIEYAKCWNNLDISYIVDILNDDLEYTSQWVFETMHGKSAYLEYLDGKFRTIQGGINIPQAELGYYRYAYIEENRPCLILTQGDVKVAILTDVRNGKLSKISMVER